MDLLNPFDDDSLSEEQLAELDEKYNGLHDLIEELNDEYPTFSPFTIDEVFVDAAHPTVVQKMTTQLVCNVFSEQVWGPGWKTKTVKQRAPNGFRVDVAVPWKPWPDWPYSGPAHPGVKVIHFSKRNGYNPNYNKVAIRSRSNIVELTCSCRKNRPRPRAPRNWTKCTLKIHWVRYP